MRILILYSSKKGTTKKVAEQISSKISRHSVQVKDYQLSTIDDINNSDIVILGTSIYIGKPSTKFQEFCIKNLKYLLNKQIALFICGLEKDKYEEEFQNAFPKELIKNSHQNGIFGGEVIMKNLNFFEKIMLKKMKGLEQDLYLLKEQEIENFIVSINSL